MHEVHLIYNSAFTTDFFKIHILSVPLALSFPQVIEKEFLVTIPIYQYILKENLPSGVSVSADLKKFFEEVSRHGKKYSMRKGKERQ